MHNSITSYILLLTLAVLYSVDAQSQLLLPHQVPSSVIMEADELSPARENATQKSDALLLSTFSDFDQWTASALSVPTDTILWEFKTDPLLTGTFTGHTVQSESVDDGFALLNFDRYTGGDTSTPPITNELTSPSYDLTSLDSSLVYELSFYHMQRQCCLASPMHTIQFSLDGGATFTEPEFVSPLAGACFEFSPKYFRLPEGAKNSSEFQVRFTYSGGFYFWAIDDISISAITAIEPTVVNFFSIAPNFETPSVFAPGTPMSFVADVQNNGAETVDLQLAITIADSNEMVVYTDTLLYEGMKTDSVAENQVFPMTAPLPTAVGNYTGTYEIFTERIGEDADPSNNTQTFDFVISETGFSKGGPTRTIDCCADDSDFSSANIYYTPDVAAGDSLFINDISFAFNAENFIGSDEAILEVKTYGFRGDLNENKSPDYGSISDPSAELVELSKLSYDLNQSTVADLNNRIITSAPNEDGSSVFVPNEFIGFAVQVDYFTVTAGTDNDFNIFGPTLGYGTVELAADSTGNSRLNQLLVVPDRAIDTYAYFGGLSPFIDANVSVGRLVSVEETVLETSQFDVRPNPATTQFAIDFDFGTAVNAQFEIINAVGQTVSVFNRDGLSSGAITIPTQGMNNGLYYVKVRTDDGQTATRKLMLNR